MSTNTNNEDYALLPQGPNCVKNLIKAALSSLNYLPEDIKQEMSSALHAFTEQSVPVAWSIEDVDANLSKSKELFTHDFPKESGGQFVLTDAEYREIFTCLIQTSSDESAQEKVNDIVNIVFDRRNNAPTKRPKP